MMNVAYSLILFCLALLSSCSQRSSQQFPYSDVAQTPTQILGCIPVSSSAATADPWPKTPTQDPLITYETTSDSFAGLSWQPPEAHASSTWGTFTSCLNSTAVSSNDPYAACQWHWQPQAMQITQDFAAKQFKYPTYQEVGLGINAALFKQAYETPWGQGLAVHVSDTGVETAHEELSAAWSTEGSKDFCDGDQLPQVRVSDQSKKLEEHGTKVAGVLVAATQNQKGIASLLGAARLRADNFVAQCAQSKGIEMDQWLKSFQGADLWNGSYGSNTHQQHELKTGGYELIQDITWREKKTFYAKAAGNERSQGGDSNRDPINSNPLVAAIGAVNERGLFAYYSNPGANLLVMGMGAGEYSQSPGICTSTVNNSYTCSFNGTSAAAPTVASIAGWLISQAQGINKTLSSADIHYLLARTATPVIESRMIDSPIDQRPYHQYSVNGAGYWHSLNYGFGIAHGGRALELLKSADFQPLPPLEVHSALLSEECDQPDKETIAVNQTCIQKSWTVNADFQVFTGVISHDLELLNPSSTDSEEASGLGQVFFTLIQPDGTRSELNRPHLKLKGQRYTHQQSFKTYAPFAINAKGRWFIEACATGQGPDLKEGLKYRWKNAKLKLYGWKDKFPLHQRKSIDP